MKNDNRENGFSRRDLIRLLGIGGLGLATNFSASNIAAQTGAATAKNDLQGAGFYRFRLGEFQCAVVSDGMFKLKPSEFFINPAAQVEKSLRAAFLPTNEITLQVNTLVVKNGKTVALMDTGVGSYAGAGGGHLLENLRRAGFSPDEITDVFISHAHFDHIGGNYNEQNILNFPNAQFHLSEAEWTAAMNEREFFGDAKAPDELKKMMIDAIRKNLAPLKDRVKLFKTNSPILPGIRVVTAFGHTPGHSTYLIESGNDALAYVGDLIHHVIQLANPQLQMFGNSFLKMSAESRRKMLEELAAKRTKMMVAHFPFPGIGNLRLRPANSGAYDWIPIEWQW